MKRFAALAAVLALAVLAAPVASFSACLAIPPVAAGFGSLVVCPAGDDVLIAPGLPPTMRFLDLDQDGDVDPIDFACFAQHWLQDTRPMTQNVDYNDDGVVSLADMAIFALHYLH